MENPILRKWNFFVDKEILNKFDVLIERQQSNSNLSEYEKRLDNINYEGKTTSI